MLLGPGQRTQSDKCNTKVLPILMILSGPLLHVLKRLWIRGLDVYLRFLIFVFPFNTGKERKSEKFLKSVLLIQKTNAKLAGKKKVI